MSIRTNPWYRILIVSFLMYTISFIDRTNISMAIPDMKSSLGMTSAAIGFATGTFFFGYVVLQIPAARLATHWSAKKFIQWLLVAWGLLSASTAIVQTPLELTINRFGLGIVEGGVLTATIILIRHWFPREERARANMLFLISIPFGGFVANPISGLILHLSNWQAMFVIEAIPAFLWAILWHYAIADRPEQAAWLPKDRKDALIAKLNAEAEEERQHPTVKGHWTKALVYPPVLWFAAYNFLALIGNWGFVIWLPSALKAFHLPIATVGLLASIPYGVGVIAMIIFAVTSDRMRERKWHMILLTAASGLFMLIEVFLQSSNLISLAIVVILFALANGAFYGRFGAFWALPSEFLPAELMGIGVAMANGIGNLGGFVGPFVVGAVQTSTHSFIIGFAFLGFMLMAGALCAVPIRVWKSSASASPAADMAT